MADTKITDLAAITSGVASTDVTVLVDVSDPSMAESGTDKKITVGDLATAITTAGSLATDTEVASAISALSAVYQPLDSDLTAIAALTTTTFGRSLLALADAAAGRTALGLGTIATQAASGVSITGGSVTGITDLAVADGGTGASTAADARTNLGLVIGTDVQAQDAELAAIAGLTSAADRLPYFTGSGTASLATFTAAGRALVDDADAAAQRTTLGLAAIASSGSASDLSAGTVATARLGSGTASSSTFLRGDQTWATPSGGSSSAVSLAQEGAALATNTTWGLPGVGFVGQSTITGVASRGFYSLFVVESAITMTAWRVVVSTAAGTTGRVVLVRLDTADWQPLASGGLIYQATFDPSSTGQKATTGLSTSVAAGLYAWVVATDGTAVFRSFLAPSTQGMGLVDGSSITGVFSHAINSSFGTGAQSDPVPDWVTQSGQASGANHIVGMRWT